MLCHNRMSLLYSAVSDSLLSYYPHGKIAVPHNSARYIVEHFRDFNVPHQNQRPMCEQSLQVHER